MEFITGSHGGVKLIKDGFAYPEKAEKKTESAGNVPSGSPLVAREP